MKGQKCYEELHYTQNLKQLFLSNYKNLKCKKHVLGLGFNNSIISKWVPEQYFYKIVEDHSVVEKNKNESGEFVLVVLI